MHEYVLIKLEKGEKSKGSSNRSTLAFQSTLSNYSSTNFTEVVPD
jgi:hypothetical protein